MKNFFTKIWETMCNVSQKNLWLFILGMFLCFILGILLPKFAKWPIVPLALTGVIVFFVNQAKEEKKDIKALVWYICGAFVPQIMFWIV